jgi:hypothetical protein
LHIRARGSVYVVGMEFIPSAKNMNKHIESRRLGAYSPNKKIPEISINIMGRSFD